MHPESTAFDGARNSVSRCAPMSYKRCLDGSVKPPDSSPILSELSPGALLILGLIGNGPPSFALPHSPPHLQATQAAFYSRLDGAGQHPRLTRWAAHRRALMGRGVAIPSLPGTSRRRRVDALVTAR